MLLPRGLLLLQEAVGPVEEPRGGRALAPQPLDGLAHGTGVVGQTLDVLEGQVDDLVAAGGAVEVAAGQALEPGLVGDAALAVGGVGPQGQGPCQGAGVQAASLAGAQLSRRPGGGGGTCSVKLHYHKYYFTVTVYNRFTIIHKI